MSEYTAKQRLASSAVCARVVGASCILLGTVAAVPVIADIQRKAIPNELAVIAFAVVGVALVPGLIYFLLAGSLKAGRRWAAVGIFAVACLQIPLLAIGVAVDVLKNADPLVRLIISVLVFAAVVLLAVQAGRCVSAATLVRRAKTYPTGAGAIPGQPPATPMRMPPPPPRPGSTDPNRPRIR